MIEKKNAFVSWDVHARNEIQNRVFTIFDRKMQIMETWISSLWANYFFMTRNLAERNGCRFPIKYYETIQPVSFWYFTSQEWKSKSRRKVKKAPLKAWGKISIVHLIPSSCLFFPCTAWPSKMKRNERPLHFNQIGLFLLLFRALESFECIKVNFWSSMWLWLIEVYCELSFYDSI